MFIRIDTILSVSRKIVLLLIIAGAVVLSIYPVSADTRITIAAYGDQSYYFGEAVVLTGENSVSDFTYLFIVGPGIPANGGKLSSPHQNVVSGNPDSFDRVPTEPDKTWEYTFYTDNLGLNPGTYTIYAVNQPETKDRINGIQSNTVSIILKRPFVSAGISPSSVPKGQPFTITGYAEGDPGSVHIWIIGDNYLYDTTVSPGPDSSYSFHAGTDLADALPMGECYLIVQHPMQNNQLDIVRDGDWVKNVQRNEGSSTAGTNIFKISGAGCLQGIDAAQAFVAGINDANVDDTCTVIPFTVDNTGISAPEIQPTMTFPVQPRSQPAPLQYAPVGVIVLIMGIAVWRRR